MLSQQHLSRAIAAAASLSMATAMTPAAAQEDTGDTMQEIRIIGSAADARTIPGSGAVIDSEQMQIEAATDINQLLKTIPGTYIREEEGYGLRPNIGIRAASSERSSKITLMEDSVLIAPAPYSNPAAYYFPTTLRMSSVETLKGAPLLRHGPQTTGGVINLVSTPIPDSNSGSIMATTGQYGKQDLHAHYGGRNGNIGWLLETAQRNSDGFKDIDRSSRDTGLDVEDYVAKLGWQEADQRLQLKLQYSEQTSNSTYLGLTDADFAADPNRRYGLSGIDQMNTRHKGSNLRYSLDLSDQVTATATGYFNEFARNWFKLDGGSAFVEAANAGDPDARAILEGTRDVSGINYKNNNRAYKSYGVALNLDIELGDHRVELGGRTHDDEMDRFQPIDIYDQVNGDLVFQEVVPPTGSNNRFETGEALSFWVTDAWQASSALRVNLALRYEDVETSRLQYASPDRSQLDGRRRNDSEQWLPGASLTYDLAPDWQVLAGVHRGFSPLGGGARAFEEPETSINYEGGLRFRRDSLFLEAIGFYSDFDDKAENCSNANPCSNGATSGSFTTGEAVVAGLEFRASSTVALSDSLRAPLEFAYTFTNAEISADNPATGFREGDTLADTPENSFSLRAGLESNSGWNNHAVARFTDETCDSVACERTGDAFSRTESLFVVDYISRYALSNTATVFLKVANLFDEQAIVSRKPDGARPNKPRTASIGFEYDF